MIDWNNVEFKGEKRFLSNMYPCSIVVDGLQYLSSENYYMSQKFVTTNKELAETLRTVTPVESKKIAQVYSKEVRKDWPSIKVDVMRQALYAKFNQNKDLQEKLLATGDEHLEERNDWNDTFWGTYKNVGQNKLGLLLMEVRKNLKASAQNAYKVGDFVTFYESFEIAEDYISNLPEDWELAFSTCDITKPMLSELDKWEDNQIASIDEDGDIKFEDIPWTWPVEVIKGLSKDQRTNND